MDAAHNAFWTCSMDSYLAPSFKVAGTYVGNAARPYFIAEAGSNFDQCLDTGRRLIDIASDAGADAVKFQLFRADVLVPEGGDTHAAFKAVELNPDWVPALSEHAAARQITFMASAFDIESVQVLEEAGVPAHKIASSEATNLDLVDTIAATGKPIFLSTGMCDIVDVQEAVDRCLARGNRSIALLQCGAMYPLPPEHVHLRVMDLFRDIYGSPVGFSDHTLGTAVTLAAAARGADVIEKHFTHDRSAEGPDHFYALEPDELTRVIEETHRVFAALGDARKDMLPAEREFGRREGLYAVRDLKAGAVIGLGDIDIRRPAIGLRERHANAVVGMRPTRHIAAGEALQWGDLAS
jgi:N,N'-diacetyllegionaminate synthase